MREVYKQSGVDVEAGYQAVEQIKGHVKRTNRLGVMGGLGGFGGLFDLSSLKVKEPVLVSGTDGVGTKLMLAIESGQLDTIGIDCVAMCVNDIVAQGAEPLYFLDYLAVGKNNPDDIEAIVAGVAEGCVQAGAALIGGETAEMPDMYAPEDFDLAGFAVGVAEKSQLLSPDKVQAGDVLIGVASSGIHSNGFSLVRKVLFKDHHLDLMAPIPELGDQVLADVLLAPTRIYVQATKAVQEVGGLHGVSHITGGGFDENIPRMLPDHLVAEIDYQAWEPPAIFSFIQGLGKLSDEEMRAVFNMGIGMVYAVQPDRVEASLAALAAAGEEGYQIGSVKKK